MFFRKDNNFAAKIGSITIKLLKQIILQSGLVNCSEEGYITFLHSSFLLFFFTWSLSLKIEESEKDCVENILKEKNWTHSNNVLSFLCFHLSKSPEKLSLVLCLLFENAEDKIESLFACIRSSQSLESTQSVAKFLDQLSQQIKNNLLLFACKKGDTRSISLLLSKEASANSANEKSKTPLLLLCERETVDLKCVQLLISKGASVNAKDTRGWTPLLLACRSGNFDLFDLLQKNGAENSAKVFGLAGAFEVCSYNGNYRLLCHLLNPAETSFAELPETNPAHTFALLQKMAEKHDVRAMHVLGMMYENGKYVKRDWSRSASLYERCAHLGNEFSMHACANLYKLGRGVEKSMSKAYEWIGESGRKLVEESSVKLAEIYFRGEGTERNYEKAFVLFEKAAERGSESAMASVGVMYEKVLLNLIF